jgi:hypothetical protein
MGARTQWFPGKWQLEAGLSHNDYLSTDRTFEYLDRGSEYLFLRGAWRFAENTQAGLEFSASQTHYRLKIQSDNTSYSLGPYANWNVTDFVTASVSGGPTIYQFNGTGPSQPASTLTSYYFDLELSHKLTEFISHNLSVRRDVNLGYNRGNDYTELLSFNYAINWAATQNANLSLNLTYEQGDQPLTVQLSTEKENFDRVGVAAGASYRFTDKLTGSLNFSHWDRTSNLPGNNYSEDSVSLQFNYNF